MLVNGTEIKSDVPGVVLNGRTMLPARAIAEAAGMDVTWNENSFTASLTTKQQGVTTNQSANSSANQNSGNAINTGDSNRDYYMSLILTHDLIVSAWNEAVNDWHFDMMDTEIDLDEIDSHMSMLRKDMPDGYANAYDCIKLMYQAYVDGWKLMSDVYYKEVLTDRSWREAYQEYVADINRASDRFEREIKALPDPTVSAY